MHISKIQIKNFRLLKDIEIDIDQKTTLIVGRNNSAKTSLLHLISKVLKNSSQLSYNDYPLRERNKALKYLLLFKNKTISFEKLQHKIAKPSITFFVDYSDEGDADNLGALSPFIIDVNYEITSAIIKAEYKLLDDEIFVRDLLNKCFDEEGKLSIENLKNIILDVFPKVFKLVISAIDPSDATNVQIKRMEEFMDLFPFYTISAERSLDEGEQQKSSSLSKIINNYFNKPFENINPEIDAEIKRLKDFILDENIKIQTQTTEILSKLIDDSIGFGYPNADELSLGVQTKLDLSNQIESKSDLTYSNEKYNDNLPSSYNGLGYKNLIKIQFELASFSDMLKDKGDACIPILCIEEPESHMHPQMQQSFIKYIDEFLKRRSTSKIQTIVTSHSSHIVNAIDFSKIRYMHRKKFNVSCKDLGQFATKNSDNLDFIRKYLTLTKCDLFFADKAIFVEGASERLLIPDVICKEEDLSELKSQYYTIVEIGGSYANKFIPLLCFLEIPSVIFTDIDSVLNRKKSIVSVGNASSNVTLNGWVKNVKKIDKVSLNDIKTLTDDEKTIENIHIEFQTSENELCGRSLEEAIKNVNREKYGLSGIITENELEFNDKSKTDFILELITQDNGYVVPEYILSGLRWLKNYKISE